MRVEIIKEWIQLYDPLFFIKKILLTNELLVFPLFLFGCVLLLCLISMFVDIISYFNNLITKPILNLLRNGMENTIKDLQLKDILRTVLPFSILSSVIIFSIILAGLFGLVYYMEKDSELMTEDRQKIANIFRTPVRQEVVELFNNNFTASSLELKEKLLRLYIKERIILNKEMENKYKDFINPPIVIENSDDNVIVDNTVDYTDIQKELLESKELGKEKLNENGMVNNLEKEVIYE